MRPGSGSPIVRLLRLLAPMAGRALHYLAGLRGRDVAWPFVTELTERLQLDLKTPIKNMSEGNKQKVGVVQALMSRPRPPFWLRPLIRVILSPVR